MALFTESHYNNEKRGREGRLNVKETVFGFHGKSHPGLKIEWQDMVQSSILTLIIPP